MWFTENAWQPMLLFALLGMICGMTWYRRLQSRYLIMLGACLVLSGATWFIERTIVTNREQVHDSIVGITSAFQKRDLDQTVGYVSKQAQDLRFLIGYAYNLVEIKDDMRVTDIEIDLKNRNSRAKSRFRVNGTINALQGGYTGHQPTRWEATWQIEEGEWRMIDIIQLDPISGNIENDFMTLRGQLNRTFGS